MHIRKFAGELFAELLLHRFGADSGVRLQLDSQNGFLGTARELVDDVHRERGGDRADITQGELDVLGPNLFLHDIESLKGDLLSAIDVGAVRSAEADAELAGFDGWKDFHSKSRPEEQDHTDGDDEINGDDKPATGDDDADEACIAATQQSGAVIAEFAGVRFSEQPDGDDRHERAGQDVRRNHCEADRHRQRCERASVHLPGGPA